MGWRISEHFSKLSRKADLKLIRPLINGLFAQFLIPGSVHFQNKLLNWWALGLIQGTGFS